MSSGCASGASLLRRGRTQIVCMADNVEPAAPGMARVASQCLSGFFFCRPIVIGVIEGGEPRRLHLSDLVAAGFAGLVHRRGCDLEDLLEDVLRRLVRDRAHGDADHADAAGR
jgi:hypothetical protein